jgi:hypothetical protein
MNPTANQVEFESGRSFANMIRSSTRRVATEAVTNHFDQISKRDALDMLSGKMTEAETRMLLTDPRMSQWMKEHKFDLSNGFDLDRMIQNRMVPNVRKVTQNAIGHGAILAKHTGQDIAWQPKRAVEKSSMVRMEETKMPEMIGHNGKGTLQNTTAQGLDFYSSMIGKNLNGVSPIDQITVGKGIAADGSSSMNLHYGSAMRADMLRDPGQQRSINVYKSIDNMDTSNARPSVDQLASVPAPEVVIPAMKDARIETGNIQKFTSKEYTETVAPRNLFDILKENQFEIERTLYDPLIHDAAQLTIQHPNWNGKSQVRPTENTHAVENKTYEYERNNHGRSLKSAIEQMSVEFIRHPEADPMRSAHEIRINSERRFAPRVEAMQLGDATHDPRKVRSDLELQNKNAGNVNYYSLTTALERIKQDLSAETTKLLPRQLDGTYDPRPSHGGREESVPGLQTFGARTEVDRGVRTPQDMPTHMGMQFRSSDIRNFGETTLFVKDRPETNYITPGARKGLGSTNVGPGDNANGKNEIRMKLVQEKVGLSNDQTSLARPRADTASVVTTRKLQMGGDVQPTQAMDESIRSERNKFMRPGSYSDPSKVGESTRGGRKVSLREALGTESAHAPSANVLII